ncbi:MULTISPECIES: hypothetical protein [unclassified Novosphingobium]|uniref:hypothetical protein n=1 Tax=unclassified Novosphingobium TaxID=2644732 RepID=UPI00135756C5|nr:MULTISPECIES: hypothetical protein [unclassified Novosphingobium]
MGRSTISPIKGAGARIAGSGRIEHPWVHINEAYVSLINDDAPDNALTSFIMHAPRGSACGDLHVGNFGVYGFANPAHVTTYVKSETHSMFCAGAWDWRLT